MCLFKLVRLDSPLQDNRLGLLLTMSILLAGLTASSAAPSGHHEDAEWYMNPCSRSTLRHGRSPAEQQLRYLNKRFGFFNQRLGMIYNVTHDYNSARSKCFKVNSSLKPIRQASNSTEAIQIFYKTTIEIAKMMNRIKNIKFETQAADFKVDLRNDLFEQMKGQLRLILCEYSDVLAKMDETSLSHSVKFQRINTECLPDSLDMSGARMFDFDFFKKLRKFFRQSQRILQQNKFRRKKQRKAGRKGIKKRTKQQKIAH